MGLAAAESDAGAGADELRERMQALVKEQRQATEQRDAANATVKDLEAEVAKLGKKASSSGKLAQMWKQIDDDDSGELDSKELKRVMLLMETDEATLDIDAAMAALDKDKSGSVSFGEFQTWWDEQSSESQDALVGKLKLENEQLKKQVEGSKTRSEKLFKERKDALQQRDTLRNQLSKAMGVTTQTLPHLAVDNPESEIAATVGKEEALELIKTLETAEEAREVCKEVGLRHDTGLSFQAMVSALNGHYDHELTVDGAFGMVDLDKSGYLDAAEVCHLPQQPPPPHPHLILTSSSPHPHLILRFSAPSPCLGTSLRTKTCRL